MTSVVGGSTRSGTGNAVGGTRSEARRSGTGVPRSGPGTSGSAGKVERFNRTMADEFLYSFTFRSEKERRRRLDRWVHDYNHHRNHTAIGAPPALRVHNVCGSYT